VQRAEIRVASLEATREGQDADADAALVAAAQRDPAAFAPLYLRYADAVHRYCARRLDDPEAAADATAAVFVRALAALPRYGERSFRAWLFRIAHNEVIDDYRRSARRCHAPLDAAVELKDRDPSPEEVAVAADEHATLAHLLAQLPEGQRRVVELRLAGLSGEEVAYTLGRSRTAVKMLQLRAVRSLRAGLAALDQFDPQEVRRGR
jgi:RNA polymerase sigma-70 factor (ECF subfamily)